MIRIAIILGSVREGRLTHKVAHFLFKRLQAATGIEPVLIDLAEHDIPILTGRWERQPDPPESLVALSGLLLQADALIFCSPEYHGSYSGVLKNAVDHFRKEFIRKPIGVVAVGAGKFGGINASTEMQQLILSLGAFPMPYKLLVPFIKEAFDPSGHPLREEIVQQTDRFVSEFLWFASAIYAAKKHPVVNPDR